jgi:hypothetical protein
MKSDKKLEDTLNINSSNRYPEEARNVNKYK